MLCWLSYLCVRELGLSFFRWDLFIAGWGGFFVRPTLKNHNRTENRKSVGDFHGVAENIKAYHARTKAVQAVSKATEQLQNRKTRNS